MSNNGRLVHLATRFGMTCNPDADVNRVHARVTCTRCTSRHPEAAKRHAHKPHIVRLDWSPLYAALGRTLDARKTIEPEVKVAFWPELKDTRTMNQQRTQVNSASQRILRADMPAAEKAICDVFDRLGDRGLLPPINKMCKAHHVKIEDIAGKNKTKSIVKARHAVWLWLHDDRGLSWPEVARLFGRSHDAIMQASDKRESRSRKVLEDRVAETIAAWIEKVGDLPIERHLRMLLSDRLRRGEWRKTNIDRESTPPEGKKP